jgi:hypothetical protein
VKLPSVDDSMHEDTFFELQKTVVRPPSLTAGGIAQILASGFGPRKKVEVAFVSFTGCDEKETGIVTVGAPVETAASPTRYPRRVHKLSKKVGGIILERKFEAHGLVLHHAANNPCC